MAPVSGLPVIQYIARRKNAIKSRIAPGLLILCLIVLSFQSFASAEALAKDPYEDWIWEPFVEND